METYEQKYGIRGAAISAVDLIRGIARYAGLEVLEVPGITGYLDTNYEGKAQYALQALEDHDFVYIHVEAPDEASHEANITGKIEAIEAIDTKIVHPILEGLKRWDAYRILVTADHPTPIPVRTHVHGPVPFAAYGQGIEPLHLGSFSEKDALRSPIRFERGYELMGIFLHGHFDSR